ncbi:MAG: zinc metalloprotease HtpX [Phycisphaerales bacterium]|nr:zinc metalloprotease HtpX [Phycisphaerales bacterium]
MRWLNNVKTAMLLGGLMGLCIAAGYFLTGGLHGIVLGFIFGGVGNLIAFFFSDRIALAAMHAREVPRAELPWLHDMVERLAARAGIPAPRVYICPQPAPNAFATGRSPAHSAVAVTEGMLRAFPQHEVEGVLAHEIAHIKHRDVLISTLAAVMAGAISMLAYMLMFMGGGRNNANQSPFAIVGAIAMMLLAPLAAGLIQMAISRQREYAADSYGGELCGDPRKLASALARLQVGNERIPMDTNPAFHNLYIAEPLSSGGIGGLFATHPPIQKRIALLQEQARSARA